jgi:hypothetical protein
MKSETFLRVVSLLALLVSLVPVNGASALPLAAPPPVDMFQLPWDLGIAWVAIDGIDNGTRRPLNSSHHYSVGGAIDFAPHNNMRLGEDTSRFFVAAAAAGTVVAKSFCHVKIDHGNGWTTEYQFLANITVNVGESVSRNQRLGIIADGVRQKFCPGSKEPNVPHVHFMLRPSVRDATLAGWEVNYLPILSKTTFRKNGQAVGLFKPLLNTFDQVQVVLRGPITWDILYSGNVDAFRYERWSLTLEELNTFTLTATPTTSGLTPLILLLDANGNEIARSPGTLTSTQPAGNYFVQIQPQAGSGSYTLLLQRDDLPSGPFVSTTLNPASVNIGQSATATVRLNNVPAEGYTSTEFTCTYNATLTEVSNIAVADLFGTDPAVAIREPQNGSFIVAVAGSQGRKATTDGTAFTFSMTGAQAGQTAVECKARVSQGDNLLTAINFIPGSLTVLGSSSTPTPGTSPTTPVESPVPTATQTPSTLTPASSTPTVSGPTLTPSITPTSAPSSPTWTPTPAGPGNSPTPSITPGGPTATAIPGTVYDFAANACAATWFSGAGQLPCPGVDGDPRGFVLLLSHPRLETGVIDSRPGLLTHPQNLQDGYIQGIYPAFHVQNGDRFRATLGCEFGATGCYVSFQLDYQVGSEPIKTLWGPFLERYEGLHFSPDVDLSSLAGKDVKFILKVRSAGPATGDRAMWVGPIIVRSGAVSTETPEVTSTPTPGVSPPPASPTPTIPVAEWLVFTNNTYGFRFLYPPQGQIVAGGTDNSTRINLPFVPGTNLSQKYLQMTVVENADHCRSPLASSSIPQTSEIAVINGITFLKETGEDGTAGHINKWTAYSTEKGNACVSLDFVLRAANPGVFTTPPPLYNEPAESLVFGQIVSTYQWLIGPETPTPTLVGSATPTATQSTPGESPTPTGLPDGTITGKVIASKPVTVSLYSTANVLVTSVTANQDGTFSLTAPAGAYKITASSSGFLRAEGPVTIPGGGAVTRPTLSLLAGDIDGNGVIDPFDVLTIGMSYNAASPSEADLNNDGVINVLDLELLASNYRKVAPQEWN